MGKKREDHEISFLVTNYPRFSTKQMAIILGRDYSVTKRKVKELILDKQANSLPDGFFVIPQSPIHAINKRGDVIRVKTRKMIKPSVNKRGYLQICLQNNKSYRIHRLVAELFVPNPEMKPQVNHLDGNKLNNYFTNLEWVTNDENRNHAIANGLWDGISVKVSRIQMGENNSSAKLKESDVLMVYDLLKRGLPVGIIAKMYNVNHSNISAIKAGKSWKHIYHYYSEGSTTSRKA